MKDIFIRKGERKDTKQVLGLIQDLATFENQPKAVIISEADLLEFGFGTNPLFYFFVAEKGNEIVGLALYYFRFSTWKGKTLHLEDLIVKEIERGNGIGQFLFDKVVNEAHVLNVGRMEWEVLDWNQPAIDFYKKADTLFDDEWMLCKLSREKIATYIKNKR